MTPLAVDIPPLQKKVIFLSWFTIGYNLIEGLVSIAFGISEDSVALAGFGLDSWVEVVSVFLVLWRFRGESGFSAAVSTERERHATFWIGFLFLLLAAITLFASGYKLWTTSSPETTLPGLLISSLSLSFMYFLWRAKKNVGMALNSRTVLQDAACSLACIKLSAVLFAGSLIFTVVPALWWADSVAALFISVFIAWEGWEAIQATRKKDFSGGCCGTSS